MQAMNAICLIRQFCNRLVELKARSSFGASVLRRYSFPALKPDTSAGLVSPSRFRIR